MISVPSGFIRDRVKFSALTISAIHGNSNGVIRNSSYGKNALVFVSPSPSRASNVVARASWTKSRQMEDCVFDLHQQLEEKHWWFAARRRIVHALAREIMQGREQELIVDVGCGTGGTVASLSEEFSCLGIDSSELAINMAKAAYPSCRFLHGRIQDGLEGVEQPAALYLLMDVLEHIKKDRDFLADIVSAARPESHVLITVPARMDLWSQHDVTAKHLRRYEMDDFTALWKGLPARPLLVSFFNSRLFPLIWTARFAARLQGGTWGREGTDFSTPPAPANRLLGWAFGGEYKRILSLLPQQGGRPYRRGVSLIALLKCDN